MDENTDPNNVQARKIKHFERKLAADADFRELQRDLDQNLDTAVKEQNFKKVTEFLKSGDNLYHKHTLVDADADDQAGYGIETAGIDVKCLARASGAIKIMSIKQLNLLNLTSLLWILYYFLLSTFTIFLIIIKIK